jgi:cytochrome c oxidase assembly protein subunit 11
MKYSRNASVVAACLTFVVGMVGLSYAAVPLYEMFCQVTGYGGTPARADSASTETRDRMLTIRFDSNVDPALPWNFHPQSRTLDVRVGENRLAFYRAENRGREPVIGRATFNVLPERAARYFTKVECFCFTEQRLEAGESVEMPVSFYIDPAILDDREASDIVEITLSYTFFRSTNATDAGTNIGAGGTGERG